MKACRDATYISECQVVHSSSVASTPQNEFILDDGALIDSRERAHEAFPDLPLGVEVPEVDALLLASVDASNRACDLSGHERRSTPGALVVEQDAVRQVHAVGLPTLLV